MRSVTANMPSTLVHWHQASRESMIVGTQYGLLSLVDHLPDPTTGHRSSAADRLRQLVDQAVAGEAAGFSSFGVGEHHFSDYILPSPELVLAAAAARTDRIRLATSVTLLAKADPVRQAERLAVLDNLSDGRAEMTFARGVSLRTAQAFGIDDFDELRPRFEEYLRLVLRLFTESEVTWSGAYRAPLDQVTLQPPTVQSPHPTIWIGGGLSTVSASLAADVGLPLALPSLFRWPEDFRQITDFYRQRHLDAGHDQPPQVAFPSYLHVARTSGEARKQWRPYLQNYQEFASGLRSGFERPTDYDSLLQGAAICGSPAEVVDRVGTINDLLGLDRHQFLLDVGGLPNELVQEQLDLVATDVLPQLQAADRDD